MAVCCICNKSRPYIFCPPLQVCNSCGKGYHVECHKPPLQLGTLENFECATCAMVNWGDGPRKPPRKRPRIEQDKSLSPSPAYSPLYSWITRNKDGDVCVKKHDAIQALRQQYPNDHRLHAILDRYVKKTATPDERQLANGEISKIARRIIDRPLESYSRNVSPPTLSRRSSISIAGTISTKDLSRQRNETHLPHLVKQNDRQSKVSHSQPKLDTFQTTRQKSSSIQSKPSEITISSKSSSIGLANQTAPTFIDLTIDDDVILDDDAHPTTANRCTQSPNISSSSNAPKRSQEQMCKVTKCLEDINKRTVSASTSISVNEASTVRNPQILKQDHNVLLGRLEEMVQKIEELEQSKRSDSDTIDELRSDVSSLESQLVLARYELKRSQTIQTSLPQEKGHLLLPLRNSQGDYPTAIPSPESDAQPGIVPEPIVDDSDREESTLQSKLDAQGWIIYEQQQKIKRLERELQQVKAGERVKMAPIAHTHIVRGMPLSVSEALLGKQSPKPKKISRKQTLSKVTMHRAGEIHTMLQAEPIRWNARDQGDRHRPKVDFLESGTLRSPATSDSNISDEEDVDFDDASSEPNEGASTRAVYQTEIPDSSTELSGTSREESSRPNIGFTRTSQPAKGKDNEQVGIRSAFTPEAVKAARAFEQAFKLDSNAVPVVSDSRLAFRTGKAERGSRVRATQDNLYRVGRDVVGEMR